MNILELYQLLDGVHRDIPGTTLLGDAIVLVEVNDSLDGPELLTVETVEFVTAYTSAGCQRSVRLRLGQP